jgi:hypothetical protein
MIDGFKTNVNGIDPTLWFNDRRLLFYTVVNVSTGELKDGTQIAKYRGLKFIVTPSKKYPTRTYCSVRGSLHMYHNHGRTNADKFTFDQLKTVLSELNQEFSIDLETSTLHGLEFGVNIMTETTAKTVLNSLVSFHGCLFQGLTNDRKTIGKLIARQQYGLKIYDKGKGSRLLLKNLLRVEVKVNRMVFLKPYGITTLADLADWEKVQAVGSVLNELWRNVIYYDKRISYKALTNFQQKKLLYYATPQNWETFNPTQRQRAKKHFRELMNSYGTGSAHSDIGKLINDKWHELTSKKCTSNNQDSAQTTFEKVKVWNPLKTNSPALEVVRKCSVCSSNISHKRKGAQYCRKQCNNSRQATIRKEQRHKLKQSETKLLKQVAKQLEGSEYELLISYRISGTTYTEGLFQSEVSAAQEWIAKVYKLVVNTPQNPLTFTSYRAKQLTRIISNQNLKQ